MNAENNNKRYDLYKVVLFTASLAALVWIFYNLREVFASITVAIFFAYILDPIATWLTGRRIGRKVVISRVAASSIAFLAGILVITVFLLILIPAIADQVQRFSDNLPAYTQKANETLRTIELKYHRMELPPSVQDNVNKSFDRITAGSSTFVHNALEAAVHFFSQIILILMIPFLTFYMLVEKDLVKKSLVGVFPRKHQTEAGQMMSEASGTLRGYIFCQLLLSLVMTVAMSTGLGLMGLKAPLLLGMIAGVSIMIPVVGVFFASIPAAFVALSISTSLAVWVIVIFTVIQLLNTKIIMPLVFSKYVNLSPLTILLALVVGEKLGGIMGMFVATPVAAVINVIYIHLREKYD